MKTTRLHWDAELGWILDVPTTINAQQLARVAAWAFPKQVDRWRSLPPGDRKDELGRALVLLRAGKVQQRLTDDGSGNYAAFKSTEKTSSRVITYG